jgi:hypothetical protein
MEPSTQKTSPTKPQEVIVGFLATEDKKTNIMEELEWTVGGEPPTIWNATVDLAVAAQQYTKKVEIPPEYQKFAKVFSKEES